MYNNGVEPPPTPIEGLDIKIGDRVATTMKYIKELSTQYPKEGVVKDVDNPLVMFMDDDGVLHVINAHWLHKIT